MVDQPTKAARIEAAARKVCEVFGKWHHDDEMWSAIRDLDKVMDAPADPQPTAGAEVLRGPTDEGLQMSKQIEELLLAADELLASFRDDLPAGEGTTIPNQKVQALRDAVAVAKAQEPVRTPGQYRCKVCGARWELLAGSLDFTLRSERCGPCCDNAPMGEQIVPVPVDRSELIADIQEEILSSIKSGDSALRIAGRIIALLPAQAPSDGKLRRLREWMNEKMLHPVAPKQFAQFMPSWGMILGEIDRLLGEPASEPAPKPVENCATCRFSKPMNETNSRVLCIRYPRNTWAVCSYDGLQYGQSSPEMECGEWYGEWRQR